MPDAQNLLREFAEFAEEQDNLFEISMSPTSLKKLSAQTGALAGMEFEMIVPGAGSDDGGDQEPDYDFDQRCRSIGDAMQFFFDGDFNGRRDVERMRERMQNDYAEWLYERIDRDFVNESEYLISEWIANNVDESEWNPNELEGEDRQDALEEFISNVDADPSSDYYQKALDEYREENQDAYDESDWLDAEDLDLMSYVENAYDVTWPHWRSTGGGEVSIEDTANSFQAAVGRDVKASGSYHSGRVERPSTKSLHYIVEPDSSLDPDDSDDQGLEFVSPPLPIEELLSDLNKVKAWADSTGCYTNDSTGLHINVSVPGWTQGTDQLDYVKLALLLGDEFVLDSFGRAGNTYAKSAMGKIRSTVKQNPDRAKELMDKMKSGMGQLASKVIHGRSTEKYTSINVKNGYIEFRSPGGDWLNDNFAEIDNTLRRFTVALSAAVDPAAYREEYLKKLYKLLDVSGEKDPLSYFAKYAAGELPRAALKSFVRQAQLERGVNRGKETGPMVWKVSNPPQSLASIEVVANSKEEAIKRATAPDGYPAWANTINSVVAEPLRPYKQEPAPSPAASTTASHPEGRGRPHDPTGRYAIVARSDQAAYGRTGGPAPNYQFRFNMQNLEDQGHGRYVLQAWAARNSVDPADYIVVDTTQYADAAQGGVIDVAPAQQPASQPAGGEFTGNWLVRAEDGTVLHRFGGIGNSQADANRTALAWAQRNPDVMRQHAGGVDVVPEMNESLREYRNALATAALAGTMAMGAQAKAPEMVHQTVEPGDTVYSIARQNNVNPLEIYRLNKMDRNTKLEVGQRVVVPDYSKPVGKMPATVAPTVKPPPAAQPAPTLKDKISSMLPKFPDDDEGVTLLSDNPDAEAALQTAAKAAGLKGSELAQFMAQTRHESWDFGKMKEVGNKKTFAKYEKPRLAKQLGNKVKGDGERFKGRGFIQLTGRDNYTRASQQIFGDDRLVKNPDLASKLDVGAQIALWFWKNQVRPAVKDFNNTTQVVKAINADEPAKVVQARHNKFKEYLAVL
jgi:putative chitinase